MSDNQPPQGPYPPQQGQPYPGQPGAYPYQPPKQKHTARNILIVLGILGVLFCGGCLAVTGLFANEVDKAITEEEENDTPTEVQVGKAFTHDGYEVAAGWKVVEEEFGGTNITGMRVTAAEADSDLPDDGRSAFLTFRFYKGTDVLLEVTCNSNEMQIGESSKMDCFGDGEVVGDYDTVKVADAF